MTPDAMRETLERVRTLIEVDAPISAYPPDALDLTIPRMLIRVTSVEWVIYSDWDCRYGALGDVEATAQAIAAVARQCR